MKALLRNPNACWTPNSTPPPEQIRPLKKDNFKRKSSSNHQFLGDMLVFGGVSLRPKRTICLRPCGMAQGKQKKTWQA